MRGGYSRGGAETRSFSGSREGAKARRILLAKDATFLGVSANIGNLVYIFQGNGPQDESQITLSHDQALEMCLSLIDALRASAPPHLRASAPPRETAI